MATVQASAPVAEKPQVPISDDSAKNVAAAIGASAPAAINVASTSDTVAGEQVNAGDKPDGKRGKNDKKPRRERPPLPDEIPTTPVKRYPEPSRSELQAKIDEHDAIVKDCFEKLAATRSFYDQRTKIREAGKAEFDGARKRLNQKNDECRVLFEKRKSLTLQIKNLREADISARTASSSSGSREENALKGLKTVQDVDDRIAQLEYEQQTVSLSMQEEKKLITQISFLKHTGRDLIMAKDSIYKEEAAAKKSRAEQRTAFEAERKELDTKIDEAKAALEELKKEVDGIRAKQDAEIKKLAEATADIDRDVIKTKINEEKSAIRKLRDDFQVELDKWYLNERIHVEQQKIAKRKKWEAQNAEREARRKAWEEEQAQYPEPDPYQKEKDMCAGLTAYLQTLLGETVEKTSAKNLLSKTGAPTLKANDGTSARSISSAGKAIGKNTKSEEFEALAFSDFMQKKKKGKKGKRISMSAAPKAASADDSDTPLKPCSIDLLAAFTHLEITPPKKFSEVREALNAVKAKKEYYNSDPAPPKPEEAVKESAPKAKQDKKSNGNVKTVADSSSTTAFPGLNSAEGSAPKATDVGVAGGSARPSFSDIAKGSAVAPSMGASAFPATMISESVGASGVDVGVIGDTGLSNGNKHESSVAPQEIAFTES